MSASLLRPDPDALRAAWRHHVRPGAVYEVRVLRTRANGPGRLRSGSTLSGYFDSEDAFVRAISPITGADATGVYITINPVAADLIARRANRLDIAGKGESTSDGTIPRLTRLLIDCDPVRPAGISATDEERAAALDRRDAVDTYLRDCGWWEPVIIAESGNGGHLIYAVDLPNGPESVDLLRRVLAALDELFSDDAVKIDTTTYNPSRIVKVPGTVAAKGDHIPERPHRMATATYVDAEPVPVEMLAAIAGSVVPSEPERAPRPGATKSRRTWAITDVLQDAGIGYRESRKPYAAVYELDRCLTSTDHADGAVILEMTSGALAYRCLHDRCAGKRWDDVKALLPIPHNERPLSTTTPEQQRQPGAAPVSHLDLVTLADVQAREIEWLWPGWVPRRMLTILGGFAGDGKSTLAAYLIAKFTRGGMFPDGSRAASVDCLMLAAEDDAAYALVPRLQLHGADLARVHLLKGTRRDDGTTAWFNLERDIALIRDTIQERKIGFVAIDPLSSYMPKADRNNEGDVRDALMPLQQLMDETGVAVLGVMHIGKGDAQRRAWQRLLGSSAFTALARSVVMLTELPDEFQEDDGAIRKAVGVVKSNYTIPPSAMMFSRPLDGAVQFHGLSPLTIEEAFAYKPKGAKKDEARDWLAEYLKDGPKPANEAEEKAKTAGFTRRTYWWARKAAGVISFKDGPHWYIQLPEGGDGSEPSAVEPESERPDPTIPTISPCRKIEIVEQATGPSGSTVSTIPTVSKTSENPKNGKLNQSTIPLSLNGEMVAMVDPNENDDATRYLARREAELAVDGRVDSGAGR